MTDIDKLVELYLKVRSGEASQSEKLEYKILFSKSCIDENTLLRIIENKVLKRRIE